MENEGNNELLKKVRTTLGDNNDGVPFLIIGNQYFNGYNENIAQNIKATIFDNLKQNNLDVVNLIKNNEPVPQNTVLDKDPTIHFQF